MHWTRWMSHSGPETSITSSWSSRMRAGGGIETFRAVTRIERDTRTDCAEAHPARKGCASSLPHAAAAPRLTLGTRLASRG